VPVIVTASPVLPEVGVTEVILKPEETVKLSALLAVPPAVTTTLPVVAPVGTGTVIDPSLALVGVAAVPLNLTVGVVPKPAPVMVTVAPIPPVVGKIPVMPGPGVTVKVEPLLGPLFTVTTTGPVIDPAGTGAFIVPEAQLIVVAASPLKVSVSALDPKFDPLTVTMMPTGPEVGERLLMVGVADTVKLNPALA